MKRPPPLRTNETPLSWNEENLERERERQRGRDRERERKKEREEREEEREIYHFGKK